MKPSEQLQRCIETGEGMTATIKEFTFTIHPRAIPGTIPPQPEPIPRFRDYKATGKTQHEWNILRACYDEVYGAHRQAVIRHQRERATVARLYRIKSVIERIEV